MSAPLTPEQREKHAQTLRKLADHFEFKANQMGFRNSEHAAAMLAGADALAALAGAETPQGMEGEAAQAYGYLSRLLTHCAPQCQPLPDLMGLCSQIDNLIAGLKAAPPPAVAPAARVTLLLGDAASRLRDAVTWMSAGEFPPKHTVAGAERLITEALALLRTPDAAAPAVAAPAVEPMPEIRPTDLCLMRDDDYFNGWDARRHPESVQSIMRAGVVIWRRDG